ncbi:acyl carrier protein [Actinomadura sp. 9N215]
MADQTIGAVATRMAGPEADPETGREAGPAPEVLRIVHDVLGRDDIRPDDDFFDAGVTSLGLIRVLLQVNSRFGTQLTGVELGDTASASRLAACVEAAGKADA